MDNKEKIKRLQKLKWYVLHPGNYGFYSHVYYRVLRHEFPFHFIEFMYSYRDPDEQLDWIQYEDHMIGDAFRWISCLYLRMEQYTQNPPTDEYGKWLFDGAKRILSQRSIRLDDEPSSES